MLGIGNLMGISGCYTVRTRSNSNVRRYEIRDLNGMVVGSYSVRTSSKPSSYQKPKKLFYNFKRISSQILKSKNMIWEGCLALPMEKRKTEPFFLI